MRHVVLLFTLTAALTAPGVAAAQDDLAARHDTEARALFDAGSIAFSEGRFADAHERFQAAYDLSHRPQLLYNIAAAADRAGDEATALRAYEQYLTDFAAADNRAYVEARIAVLRSRIAEADASDESAAVTEEVVVEPRPSVAPVVTSDPTAAIVLFTLAGLVGAGAIGTGAAGWSLRGELESACPGHVCPGPETRADADTMATLGITTDVLAGTSLALATAGLFAAIFAPTSETPSVAVGPGYLEVRGRM